MAEVVKYILERAHDWHGMFNVRHGSVVAVRDQTGKIGVLTIREEDDGFMLSVLHDPNTLLYWARISTGACLGANFKLPARFRGQNIWLLDALGAALEVYEEVITNDVRGKLIDATWSKMRETKPVWQEQNTAVIFAGFVVDLFTTESGALGLSISHPKDTTKPFDEDERTLDLFVAPDIASASAEGIKICDTQNLAGRLQKILHIVNSNEHKDTDPFLKAIVLAAQGL